jgi:hypothetical protein
VSVEDSTVRTVLLESVPSAPPMKYTAQSLLAAGARARRRRRLAGGGISLLAVAALVGAFALLGAPSLPARPEPAAKPAATPLGPVGKAWYTLDPAPYCDAANQTVAASSTDIERAYREYATPYPAELPDQIGARMSCYLMSVVPAYLPGAALYMNNYRVSEMAERPSAADPPLKGSLDAQVVGAPGDQLNRPSFSAAAIVADAAGVGTVEFQVNPAGSYSAQDMADNCRSHVGVCELRTGPHGETVGVWTVEDPDGYKLIDVDVYIGHTIVLAIAANDDPSAWPGDPRVGRASPPLNVDQLLAIAASPELALRLAP